MFKPQPGFQESALSTSADIAIIGGSAGGGKTFMEILEATRHTYLPDFGFVGFRRTTTQIRAQGGLWDTSKRVYPLLGAQPRESSLEWIFPSGAKGKFAHLEHEKDVYNWQGSEIPLIMFDELTHFTEFMFWYMVSRNRSSCGIRPYIRATCNPDPNSWVVRLIAWWIDEVTGYPIMERAGVLRYLTRDGDELVWGDTPEEVIEKCPHIFNDPALVASGVDPRLLVKSLTFIPGSIYDNKIFIAQDPAYLGNLLSLQPEEKLRLLGGNWKISLDGLMLVDWPRIESLFTNFPEMAARPLRCITVDAARFGKDLAVIYVWKGFEVIYTVIYKISDAHDLNDKIEQLRQRFSVVVDDVLVDADGVGDGTVKLGGYAAFHGGATAEEIDGEKYRYKNLKTQCVYLMSKRMNEGGARFSFNSETVEIHDGSSVNGQLTLNIKLGSRIRDVRDMLKEEVRTWKRKEVPDEDVMLKQMITKEEQKNALGRSPDLSDAAFMREYLELRPQRKRMRREN